MSGRGLNAGVALVPIVEHCVLWDGEHGEVVLYDHEGELAREPIADQADLELLLAMLTQERPVFYDDRRRLLWGGLGSSEPARR